MSEKMLEYKGTVAFHPGYYVEEVIEDMEVRQAEFARRLDVNPKILSDLVNGKTGLSKEIAAKLAQMLGTSVEVWLNLQASYDALGAKKANACLLRQDIDLLTKIDGSYFVRQKLLPSAKNKEEQVTSLRRLLKVSSLQLLRKKEFLNSCKTAGQERSETNILNSNIWIQLALNEAEKVKCSTFDKVKLRKAIAEIKRLTLLSQKDAYAKLSESLANCGVVLVVMPYLKNSALNGAVRWMNDKCLLALNDRNPSADYFWYTLFHELYHVLAEKKNTLFVDAAEDEPEADAYELAADTFARRQLISDHDYAKFVTAYPCPSDEEIVGFAVKEELAPFVVYSRLKREGKIPIGRGQKYEVKYR